MKSETLPAVNSETQHAAVGRGSGAPASKIGLNPVSPLQGTTMSSPAPHQPQGEENPPQDGVEAIVPAIPLVLPLIGGVLMFLLAFIAIHMA